MDKPFWIVLITLPLICLTDISFSQCNSFPDQIGSGSGFATVCSIPASLYTVNGPFWTISNKNIYINGTLTVDHDLILDHCTIEMGSGAIIDILPGFTLKIEDYTHISSCAGGTGTMWEHIAVQGTLLLLGKLIVNGYSKIEDAENAVYLPGNSSGTFEIEDAFFNRNFHHIFLDYFNGGLPYSYYSTVIRTEFTCKSPSGISGLALNAPHSSPPQRTDIAIWLDHVFGAVPLSGTTYMKIGELNNGNFFENSNTQIFSHQSRVWVEDNTLREHHDGIKADFDGELVANENQINFPSNNGIEAFNYIYKIDIYNNSIEDAAIGVYLHDCNFLYCNISDNHIQEIDRAAIFLNDNFRAGTAEIFINDNQLSNSNKPVFENTAVFIGEQSMNKYASSEIRRNQVENFFHGIACGLIYNPQITDNNVLLAYSNPLPVNFTTTGIYYFYCGGALINDNVISSEEASACDDNTLGILNINSPYQYLEPVITACNSVENVSRGMSFAGETPFNIFAQNVMGFCKYQFYLLFNPNGLGNQPNTMTGESPNYWNQLQPTCDPYNTYGENSNISPGFTNFYYYFMPPNYNPNNPPNNGMLTGNASTFTHTWDLSNNTYCPEPPTGGGEFANLLSFLNKVAGDSIDWSGNETGEWKANYNLFNTLKMDSLLKDSVPLFQQSYDSLFQTNIGLMSSIIDSIENVNPADSVQINNLMALNNSVSTDIGIESNEKAVNVIQLQVKENGMNSVTSSQADLLRNIAQQCIITGGPAVFRARLLLYSIDTAFTYYHGYCDQNLFRKNEPEIKISFSNLFPNPAFDQIVISYDLNLTDQACVTITDMQGRERLKTAFSTVEHTLQLDVSPLTSGIYFVKIFLNNSPVKTEKLIVIK